ncbi:phosphoenolpyruvate carboxykinase domain-containing protein [Verrucomicrobiota bacterium]
MAAKTTHPKLLAWVAQIERLCKPDAVEWVDGSKEEYDRLMKLMVDTGMATKLNEAKRPNSYLFRSDPTDVARVEGRTYIASRKEEDAGPTNNWIDPDELKVTMTKLYDGCMKGRTMYIIPFSMCPVICPDWEDPKGVPVDIFIFGGRRSSTIPLVHQAFDWDHAVYMGATAASELTSAALDVTCKMRRDPFAMKPFIGYNAGDYMAHWFEMGDLLGAFFVVFLKSISAWQGRAVWAYYALFLNNLETIEVKYV